MEAPVGEVVTLLPIARLCKDGWEISYDDGKTWRTPKRGETKIRAESSFTLFVSQSDQ
jgi:hypothetical protein